MPYLKKLPVFTVLFLCLVFPACRRDSKGFAVEDFSKEGFSIEGTTLVKYTGTGGDVIIPAGITAIGDNAFEECTTVTSIIIPNSVISIEEGAFELCKNLTSITIPDSVKYIGNQAFGSCSNLTTIIMPRETETGKNAIPSGVEIIYSDSSYSDSSNSDGSSK